MFWIGLLTGMGIGILIVGILFYYWAKKGNFCPDLEIDLTDEI